MKVFFVGSLYPDNRINEFISNSKKSIDNPANNLQNALLKGFDLYFSNIIVVTLPGVYTFPLLYRKPIVKNSIFNHKKNVIDFCVGFINIPVIKHFSRYLGLYFKLKKMTKKDENITVFIYAVHSPFLKAIFELKKIRPNLKTCLIVPDLPQYMSESKNKVYLSLKKIDLRLIDNYIKKIDSFVLLNDNMLEYINFDNKPWVRVEGIYNYESQIINVEKEIFKTILYTGKIDERYGINTLLKAFSLIEDQNYRLWIRGDGNTKNNVIKASKVDSRIIYFEEMSRDELLKLQKKATILINPVSPSESFTKFFFPSKIMDYLASGTPTISTKIACIPEDYYDYLYFSKGDDAESIKEIIVNVCSKSQSELDIFGKKASEFIFDQKTPKIQVKKIIEMISKLN